MIPIATAQQGFNLYRSRAGMGLAQGSLLPIANGSDVYGLHPSLAEIQGLYNAGHAAVLANVGMLVKPMTRTALLTPTTVPLCPMRCSRIPIRRASGRPHSTGLGSTGWGGRMADLMQASNSGATFPSRRRWTDPSLFLTGQQTFAANVPGGSATLLIQ